MSFLNKFWFIGLAPELNRKVMLHLTETLYVLQSLSIKWNFRPKKRKEKKKKKFNFSKFNFPVLHRKMVTNLRAFSPFHRFKANEHVFERRWSTQSTMRTSTTRTSTKRTLTTSRSTTSKGRVSVVPYLQDHITINKQNILMVGLVDVPHRPPHVSLFKGASFGPRYHTEGCQQTY